MAQLVSQEKEMSSKVRFGHSEDADNLLKQKQYAEELEHKLQVVAQELAEKEMVHSAEIAKHKDVRCQLHYSVI